MKIKKIQSKSAISKCGFPGGGWAINPYVGCGHNCQYCYARFMKRFTGHSKEDWGNFVDARVNIPEILEKQLKSSKYENQPIFIGTVTDPYQPIEEKYQITKQVLELLKGYNTEVNIMTKSDLVIRDIEILKQMKNVTVNMTMNSLDEKFQKLIEPGATSIKDRLEALKVLNQEGISTVIMLGPVWPIFTDVEKMFQKFKYLGIKHVFSESLNTTGGNWSGVEEVLKKHYPDELEVLKKILFDKISFTQFYNQVNEKIEKCSDKYEISSTVYFAPGHAGNKFKK